MAPGAGLARGADHRVDRLALERTIEDQIRDYQVNFICLAIDSPGGVASDSMNLANFLADLDPAQVRVVAYVPAQALSDAALVAMAADQLVMHHDAVMGGEGETNLSPEDLQLVRETLRDNLAPKKSRSWSLTDALVDPQLQVFRYTNRRNGAVAYFSEEELETQEAPDDWNQGVASHPAGRAAPRHRRPGRRVGNRSSHGARFLPS